MSGDHDLGNTASEGFDSLRNENMALREENRILKERISFLEGHPTLSEGLRGERFVQRIIGGMLTTHTDSCDLALETGQLIEIKMAKLNLAVKGFTTKRWAWGKIFGEHGSKRFDFAILAGHVDERFRDQYADPSSPYVFFLVRYDELRTLTSKSGKWEGIFLSTNPARQASKAGRLFRDYQVTIDDLNERFGL